MGMIVTAKSVLGRFQVLTLSAAAFFILSILMSQITDVMAVMGIRPSALPVILGLMFGPYVEKVLGTELPESFKFNVIEHDPAYFATIALPPIISGEIPEEDLEMVAGGGNLGCNSLCSC